MSDLHMKLSDAVDYNEWRVMNRGNEMTAIVMLWVEYELYISGVGSRRLTWIKGRYTSLFCFCIFKTRSMSAK